jgi:hypothetical protein
MNRYYYIFFFLLFCSNSFGQTDYFKEISKVKGDLNKDALEDLIVISQDTLDNIAPYRLEIFFFKPNRKKVLILKTDKGITPQFPNGKQASMSGNDFSFSNVSINHGIVSINYEYIRGHSEYKFRYQNKNFELIGYTSGGSDGRDTISYTDFNLSTGVRLVKIENYKTDKVLSINKKVIKLIPLPNLKDYNALDEHSWD